jgi:hypothetical protein
MLLAATRTWADFTNRLPGFWELLGMTFVTALLIWGIFRLKAWFRDDDDPAAAERQLLLQLNEMTREGELSEDEYRLLKRKLGSTVAGSMAGSSNSSARTIVTARKAESPLKQESTDGEPNGDKPSDDKPHHDRPSETGGDTSKEEPSAT